MNLVGRMALSYVMERLQLQLDRLSSIYLDELDAINRFPQCAEFCNSLDSVMEHLGSVIDEIQAIIVS